MRRAGGREGGRGRERETDKEFLSICLSICLLSTTCAFIFLYIYLDQAAHLPIYLPIYFCTYACVIIRMRARVPKLHRSSPAYVAYQALPSPCAASPWEVAVGIQGLGLQLSTRRSGWHGDTSATEGASMELLMLRSDLPNVTIVWDASNLLQNDIGSY